jgi:hypothetical protein
VSAIYTRLKVRLYREFLGILRSFKIISGVVKLKSEKFSGNLLSFKIFENV